MAERMKEIMDKLISTSQSTFISSRGMLEGILVLNELVDFAKRNKKNLFLFKMDSEKAFDSVSREYLFYVLEGMNFSNTWIQWIKSCIRYSSLSILINGSPIVDFQMQRGFRQGDPPSSFLFILAAKGITRLMKNVRSSNSFQYFSLSNHLHFDLLQFTDDMMIIGQTYLENILSIKAMLRMFELVSGLSVNF